MPNLASAAYLSGEILRYGAQLQIRLAYLGGALKRLVKALNAFSLACLVCGCAAIAPADASLFARMGGMPVIAAVVDEAIDAVAADPKTRRTFEDIKLAAIKQSVSVQFCALVGGGCRYEGETMKKAHTGMRITDTEFDVMVGALRTALDRHVGEREKNELLKLLAPMKRDIVGV